MDFVYKSDHRNHRLIIEPMAIKIKFPVEPIKMILAFHRDRFEILTQERCKLTNDKFVKI